MLCTTKCFFWKAQALPYPRRASFLLLEVETVIKSWAAYLKNKQKVSRSRDAWIAAAYCKTCVTRIMDISLEPRDESITTTLRVIMDVLTVTFTFILCIWKRDLRVNSLFN